MIKGECNCGCVAFEVSAPVEDIYFCHCSICRKATGVNGIAVIVVENQFFVWKKGQANISTWKKPDADWQTWFCKTCGSVLPGENDPERMFVPAGLIIEGGEQLKVKHHIFVDSKASWDEICGDGRLHSDSIK